MISYKKILFVFLFILLGGVVIFLRGNYSENSVFSENESGSSEQSPVVTETEIAPVAKEDMGDKKGDTKEFHCTQEKPVGAREHEKVGDTVVRYATVLTWSTSGEARFFYYDPEKKTADNRRGNCNWFFADSIIHGVSLDKFLDRLNEYEDYAIKIVGMKREDDCGYYQVNNDANECLESIAIKEMIPIHKFGN